MVNILYTEKEKSVFFNVVLVYHLVQYNLSLKFLPSEHVFFSAKKRWATLKLGSRKWQENGLPTFSWNPYLVVVGGWTNQPIWKICVSQSGAQETPILSRWK